MGRHGGFSEDSGGGRREGREFGDDELQSTTLSSPPRTGRPDIVKLRPIGAESP